VKGNMGGRTKGVKGELSCIKLNIGLLHDVTL
jgi:hypothetical protein